MNKVELDEFQQDVWEKLNEFDGAYSIPLNEIRNGDILITRTPQRDVGFFHVGVNVGKGLINLDDKKMPLNEIPYNEAIRIGHFNQWKEYDFLSSRVVDRVSAIFKGHYDHVFYLEDILQKDILFVQKNNFMKFQFIHELEDSWEVNPEDTAKRLGISLPAMRIRLKGL
jgi:hypothetical protein